MSALTSPAIAPPDERFAVIKFIEEPPKHIFVEEWFDVGISIQLPRSKSVTSGSTYTVELKPSLYRWTRGKTSSQPVSRSDSVQLSMNPPTISLPVSKTGSPSEHIAKARCRISCPVQSSKPTAFSIQFNDAKIDNPLFEVKPSFSQPLTIVNAKLKVESPGWEDTWYKDMGGRDKAMLAVASLCDKDGRIITDRKVPLHLTLRYDNEERSPVTKQDIFRMVGSSFHYIDPETGKASLQFRIEDVSKNHQGQNFIVEIGADKERSPDVAPAYSRSVCIRSKKKIKRAREDAAPTPQPTRPHPTHNQNLHSVQTQPPSAYNQPPPTGFQATGPSETFTIAGGGGGGSSHNSQQVRQAMRGVIQWTEEIVKGSNSLGHLRWNVIGYAQNPDGSIDYNRPYYSMPNPNERINKILNMYAEETREHLRVLLASVEQSTKPDSYGGSSHSTSSHPASSNLPSSHSTSSNIANSNHQSAFRPTEMNRTAEMRQWQTYQDHPQYMQNLVTHGSDMSPQAPTTMPGASSGMPTAMPASGMPPLHNVPMQTNPGYWGMHNTQGIHTAAGSHSRPGMGPRDSERGSNQGEPEMSDMAIDGENRQADVQYVFAKVFKSLRSHKRLGFPAYSITNELLGFYREPSMGSGSGRFVPIQNHKEEFGPEELEQASRILRDAIVNRSRAVHSLKDWDSLTSMVDHALVYDWTKDALGGNSSSSGSGDVEIGSIPPREYL